MIYMPRDPVGYKNLIVWSQAGKIYRGTKDFTRKFLDGRSEYRLVGHMNDSARSVQRNIEEGYKRATTKEYIQFLGFSRASLEELKGDFEELKREWGEGLRWADKGKEGVIREDVRRENVIRGDVIREDMRKENVIREGVRREIEGLLDLIYGEDCMMGRQIMRLEAKMVSDKTMSRSDVARRVIRMAGSDEKRFWTKAEERFGVKRPGQ